MAIISQRHISRHIYTKDGLTTYPENIPKVTKAFNIFLR